MKKFLAIVLALVLVMINVAAMAVPNVGEFPENDNPYIEKKYAGELVPAETLEFSITKVTTGAPDIIVGTKTEEGETVKYTYNVTGGTTKTYQIPITVNVADFPSVGEYEYTVKEITGNTQGVTYTDAGKNITVKVYVGYALDENNKPTTTKEIMQVNVYTALDETNKTKEDTINNTYDVGQITVEKEVKGNLGDTTKPFTIQISLITDNNMTVRAPITVAYEEGATMKEVVSGGEGDTETSVGTTISADWTGTRVFKLTAHDLGKVTLTNVPYGVNYTVTEIGDVEDIKGGASEQLEKANNVNAYAISYTENEGEVNSTRSQWSAKVTNTKEIEIPTGITLETLPYVLIMAIAVMGAVALFARKREEY